MTLSFGVVLFFIMVLAFITQYLVYVSTSLVQPSQIMPLGYVCVMAGFLSDVYLFEVQFGMIPILGILMTSVGLLSGYLVSKPKTE
jgi:hypothetical protein